MTKYEVVATTPALTIDTMPMPTKPASPVTETRPNSSAGFQQLLYMTEAERRAISPYRRPGRTSVTAAATPSDLRISVGEESPRPPS